MTRTPITSSLWLGLIATIAGCNVINDGLLGPEDPIDAPTTDSNDDPVDAALDGRPPPTPLPNVILNYKFEETGTLVFDYSGRSLDAEATDAEMPVDTGRVGRGLSFNGANPATQYVVLPSGVLDAVNDFTISVWIRPVVSSPWARVYDIGNGLPDPANRFMFMTLSGFNAAAQPVGLHTTSYGGVTTNEIMASANALLPSNVWKHIALVGTAGARTLYVDGFPVSSVTGGANVPPGEMEPLAPQSWIGRSRFPDPGLNGTLDEFRIYDRALNASEVADLAWPQQDYSHWRFDDATGTVLSDKSDRGNTGALHNDVTWAQGRLGGALDFGGGTSGTSGPYVSLAGSPLNGCTSNLTIAAWVRLRTAAAGVRVLDLGTGSGTVLYLSPNDGTGVHVTMQSPAGTFNLATTSPIAADDMWHHVAVTFGTSNTVVVYLDGVATTQATSPTVRPSDFASTTENWIGRSRAGGPALDGMVDELRISCRAFTADEIKMLAHR
jgi:hypothetical protein